MQCIWNPSHLFLHFSLIAADLHTSDSVIHYSASEMCCTRFVQEIHLACKMIDHGGNYSLCSEPNVRARNEKQGQLLGKQCLAEKVHFSTIKHKGFLFVYKDMHFYMFWVFRCLKLSQAHTLSFEIRKPSLEVIYCCIMTKAGYFPRLSQLSRFP